ncbi:MAG: hypothetical protein NC131_11490 [Roseburia sp.]|nr:hypothetical protein [Roseburia sp.]
MRYTDIERACMMSQRVGQKSPYPKLNAIVYNGKYSKYLSFVSPMKLACLMKLADYDSVVIYYGYTADSRDWRIKRRIRSIYELSNIFKDTDFSILDDVSRETLLGR